MIGPEHDCLGCGDVRLKNLLLCSNCAHTDAIGTDLPVVA